MERIIYFKILNNQLIIDDNVKYSNNYNLAYSFNDFKTKINDIQNRLNSLLLEYNINSCVIYINLFKELSELLNKCSSITELKINSNLIIDKNIFQKKIDNYNDISIPKKININDDIKEVQKKVNKYNKYKLKRFLSIISSLIIIFGLFIYVFITIKDNNEVSVIENQVNEITDIKLKYVIDDDNLINNNNIDITNVTNINYPLLIEEMKNINSDTVGWLSINNTKIDYPIVQTDNNDFYLNNDFKKQSNTKGWIFLDYRNSKDKLDKNTIIYGHNIVSKGIMFADIAKLFENNYFNNDNNKIITTYLNDKLYTWEIFSIYKIDETTDYLKIIFNSNEFINYINMINNRSEYNFNKNINEEDNILTLSTCHTNSTRYVVHAVLKK